MRLKIYHIDAFTNEVFKGNYAAVIITDEWLPDNLMQSIASENNLSETAFVLFSQDKSPSGITFSAKTVGDLTVRQVEDGFIEMTFPNRCPYKINLIPKELIKGLSIKPNEVLLNQQVYFVIYANEEDVRTVIPNQEELKKLAPYDVVVSAASNKYDFNSRYFWPANGTGEDPVTGSIHAGLAPFWAERLGRNKLIAYQASERGGILKCRVEDNHVFISGKAVQYLEGYIDV
ncbi:MAG: PhzF family phenazine biosynthesis protein [Spirochaetia bacterium]|jgi:predicted PhzF superfamily epimerase YddE/YHI9|nr:PhzF family phenazine biosynthesis protein [Spirochaetia bacterium]